MKWLSIGVIFQSVTIWYKEHHLPHFERTNHKSNVYIGKHMNTKLYQSRVSHLTPYRQAVFFWNEVCDRNMSMSMMASVIVLDDGTGPELWGLGRSLILVIHFIEFIAVNSANSKTNSCRKFKLFSLPTWLQHMRRKILVKLSSIWLNN